MSRKRGDSLGGLMDMTGGFMGLTSDLTALSFGAGVPEMAASRDIRGMALAGASTLTGIGLPEMVRRKIKRRR
jgi:hypothetical protein